MATVAGQGTTFNLPNFTGELFQIAPSDTPFLSSIGGLSGYQTSESTEFEWQTIDLRTTSANNVVVEGATAPAASNQSRSNVTNVVEIHQRSIEVSYTKLAARQLKSGSNNAERNPIDDELAFQTMQELKGIAIDIEKSFLSGIYAKPVTNATPRQTRGLIPAITSNVNANAGVPRPITKTIIDATLRLMYDNGAPLSQDNTVLMCGSAQKVNLSNAYATPALSQMPFVRTIAGYSFDTIVTDFGTFGVMLNRWFPAGQIGVVDLSVCNPVFLDIPGKGSLFVEPLARTGASSKFQLYGEIGLKYGPETYHGLIKDLS